MSSKVYNSNTACCSIPVVVPDEEYKHKGEYKAYGPFKKAYVVGKPGSDKAIIGIYDIFGYFPQTIQGADIIAESLGAFVVYPDFFDGKPWPNEAFPPRNEEEGKKLQTFFGETANLDNRVAELNETAELLKKEGAKHVGTIGFCWGGKLSTVAATKGKIDAAVAIHPAMLDVKDAQNLKVPLAIFPSKDEPLEEYEKIVDEIGKKDFAAKNAYKVYPDMHHGWAAARADLKDANNKKAYEDVYGTSVTFFKNAIA
ncbi:dienelactone hydrolase family protein [Ceratobasidium sp. AG-Ba]|nr:dienelactone hydrolase family protein [Ceratobasidium sp. AG-Ba]